MDWSEAVRSESPPLLMETGARVWPQSISEFEAMIDSLQHRLVHFAFCRLQSRDDAEDVVQDVLVQAYRDRQKHRTVDNAAPFLFRMVANRCADVLRKRKRDPRPLDEFASEVAAPDTGGAIESLEAVRRLRRAEELLARLPSKQAQVIRLRIYGDLSFQAVAQAAGCSVPTVKSRFRYGIQKLRKTLKRLGGER